MILRSHSLRWLSAAAIGVLSAGLFAVGGPGTGAAAQELGDMTIAEVDIAEYPDIELEVSIPSGLIAEPVNPDDIALLENGQLIPAEVKRVPTDQLEIVLLIDTSGSMREGNALSAATQSAVGFLAELPDDVPVGIVAFANSPALVSPLTTDRLLLNTSLGRLSATGETALYDGIVFGRSLFSGGTTDRHFVLLSDGGDTVSLSSFDDALAAIEGISISTLELVTSESNQQALVDISESSSGSLTSISDPGALAALYRDVASSLVNRYTVTASTSAGGPVSYTVAANAAGQLLSATADVALPEPAAPATTTPEVASTTPVTTPPPTTIPSVQPIAVAAGTPPPPTEPSEGSRLLLIGGAIAIFLMIVGMVLAIWPSGERRIGRRQLGVDGKKQKAGKGKASVGDRISAMADDALERGGKRTGLANALDVAAVSLRPGEFVVLVATIGLVAAALLLALMGPVGAVIGLIATPFVGRAIISVKADRRRKAFDEQLPDVLQLLTSALRSGYALPQGLDAVANQAAEPARTEFQRVMFETRVGRDLGESLNATAERMQSTAFGWVVSALEINREVGGELAQVLETLGETVRQRQKLERQIQTLTAEGRVSAYVLTGLPVFVVVGIGLINPSYFEPMTSSPGPAILAFSGVLLVVGWFWMRRLIKTEY